MTIWSMISFVLGLVVGALADLLLAAVILLAFQHLKWRSLSSVCWWLSRRFSRWSAWCDWRRFR